MRKLSLKTYSIYELRKINVDHSLKIMNMLYDVEKNNVRLLAPLVTWLYLNSKNNINAGQNVSKLLKDIYKKYPNVSEENMLNYLKHSKNEELNKYYKSYVSENQRRDEDEFKDKMRNLIKILKSEKDLSNYEICKRAKVDAGNFHSFYSLNRNDRLSKEKIKTIVQICNDI